MSRAATCLFAVLALAPLHTSLATGTGQLNDVCEAQNQEIRDQLNGPMCAGGQNQEWCAREAAGILNCATKKPVHARAPVNLPYRAGPAASKGPCGGGDYISGTHRCESQPSSPGFTSLFRRRAAADCARLRAPPDRPSGSKYARSKVGKHRAAAYAGSRISSLFQRGLLPSLYCTFRIAARTAANTSSICPRLMINGGEIARISPVARTSTPAS